MFRIKTTFLFVTVLIANLAQGQAYISERLQEKMDSESASLHWVKVEFQSNVDCQLLIDQYRQEQLISSERAKRTILKLQEQTRISQGKLLEKLSKKSGDELGQLFSYWIVNLMILNASPEVIQEIASSPEVMHVDIIEGRFEAHEPIIQDFSAKTATPNGCEPGLKAINAPAMWQLGYTGRGRVGYNYDTGVWPNHPAFKDRFMANFYPMDQCWYGFFSETPNGNVSDHGTHTLGTTAGLDRATNDTIGVAFGSYWIANDFVTSTVAGLPPLVDMIGAFQWALNPDGDVSTTHDIPDVINNSWRWYDIGDTVHCGGFIVNLMNAIEAAGIANVFSGGNFGPSNTTISSPQRINTSKVNTFSVGSVDGNQSFPYPISAFSSRGPTQCPGSGSLSIHPEVVAPGQNVRSAWGSDSYNTISGTSMAAPHVSGAILLLKEAFPSLSGDVLLDALYSTAVDMGSVGEDNTFGRGLIDVHAAYQQLSFSFTPVDPTKIKWDLIITDLSSPSSNGISCDASYNPVVQVMNGGDSTITRIDFGYKVNDNGLPVGHTWTGNLASGQSISINLPNVTFTGFGEQELVLEAIVNSGQAEYDEHNNRRIVRFNRRETRPLPFTEDFENGIGNEWLVSNEDGAIGWDTITIGGRGSNEKAAQLALYNYNPRNSQKDGLISPELSIPTGGNPMMKFDVSYQRLLSVSQLQDTLRVYASTDCGLSFSHLLYEKFGAALSTNDTSTQNFIPEHETHWRRDSVDLSSMAGNDILLQIVGVNRKGNNLYIDNVSVFDGPDPIGLTERSESAELLLFPNPVEEALHLSLENYTNQSFGIEIYNTSGQLVLEGLLQSASKKIEVEALKPGVYIIQLKGDKQLINSRFIKR